MVARRAGEWAPRWWWWTWIHSATAQRHLQLKQQPTPYLTILVRTRIDSPVLAASIRQAVAALDPTVPVTRVDDMPTLVRRSFANERFRALLIGLFAGIASALAVIGIYGVTARAVARQRREIGIRLALGATAGRVVELFVRADRRPLSR